jgi:hypothetical protein
MKPIQLPFNPGKEQSSGKICMLIGMDDIAAIGIDKVSNFGYQPPLIGAGN